MIYITDYINKFDIEKSICHPFKVFNWESKFIPYKKIEVLLVWHQKIDEKYLQNFPNLKGIIRYGVGYDNINLKACEKNKIIFCNNPSYGVDEVSDTALSMIMYLTRAIGLYHYKCLSLLENEDGSWQENTFKEAKRLNNLHLGVIGCGKIGTALVRKSKEIFQSIGIYDPFLPSGFEKSVKVNRYNDLNSLLMNSDIVSLHVPLKNDTRGLVNKKFLNSMKKGSILINTARGELISDISYLINKVCDNSIWGFGLDVLDEEPPKGKKKKLLIDLYKLKKELTGRFLINPHTSYYSEESYKEMRTLAAKNGLKILHNKLPLNRII